MALVGSQWSRVLRPPGGVADVHVNVCDASELYNG